MKGTWLLLLTLLCASSSAGLAVRAKAVALTLTARPTLECECWQLSPYTLPRTACARTALRALALYLDPDLNLLRRLALHSTSWRHRLAKVKRQSREGDSIWVVSNVRPLTRCPVVSGELLGLTNAVRLVRPIRKLVLKHVITWRAARRCALAQG